MTKFYIDQTGVYLGGFDGAVVPTGAVEVSYDRPHGGMVWTGTAWEDSVNQAITTKIAAIDALHKQKLTAGITFKTKTFVCSDMSAGGIAAKLENLKRENAATARTITGVTLTNPVVVTSVAHGFFNLDLLDHSGVGGTIELVGVYAIGNVTTDTYELTGVDGTLWTAFTSGGLANLMCRWTSNDNTMNEFSAADFTTLANSMNNFNDLCFNRARTEKNEVLVLTSTASVNAYDITLGWPPNVY